MYAKFELVQLHNDNGFLVLDEYSLQVMIEHRYSLEDEIIEQPRISFHTKGSKKVRKTLKCWSILPASHHKPMPHCNIKEYVYLSSKDIKAILPSYKLYHRRLGPFNIIEPKSM